MVALLAELDSNLGGWDGGRRRQTDTKHVDFFELGSSKKSVIKSKNPVTGYNEDELSGSLYDVSDLSRDVYVNAVNGDGVKGVKRVNGVNGFVASKNHHQRRSSKKIRRLKRQQQQDDDEQGEEVVILEPYLDRRRDDDASTRGRQQQQTNESWHDLVLYAMSGVLLIFVLEHAFRMGARYSTI